MNFLLKLVILLSKPLLLSQLILIISSSLVFSQGQNNSILNEIRRIQRDLAVLNREVFNRDQRDIKNLQVNKNSPSLSSNPYVVRIEEKLEQLRAIQNSMKINLILVDDKIISIDTLDDVERFKNAIKD